MTHELNPEHEEVARKATERIKQSIARVIFIAAETIDEKEDKEKKNE